MDFIWQLETTSLVVGLRRSSKVLPKAKLTPKKGDGYCFGGLLLVWFTTAFWILVKPLHLRSLLSTLMRCTEKFNACSQHWSTEWAQISMKKPNSMFHKQRFKSWMNWAMQFCLIGHIHLTSCQPATTSSSISTNFCRENVSTTSMRKKNAFQEFLESWSTNFYATGINKLISYWQKCVDLNSSYFS